MQPIYVSKSLSVASSTGLGSISTAATPVITVNTSNMDTARRVMFSSTGDDSTLTLIFTGKIEGGQIVSEAVRGSTASGLAATTLTDFLSLTSVTASSAVNIAQIIGTSSVGGTPWKVVNTAVTPIAIGAAITLSSSGSAMTGQIDMTLDDPMRTYANPGFAVPIPFNSTSHVGTAASTNSFGIVNSDGQNYLPIAGWRFTIGSTGGSSQTISATVIQAGIG